MRLGIRILAGLILSIVNLTLILLIVWQLLALGVSYGIPLTLLVSLCGILAIVVSFVVHELGHLSAGVFAKLSFTELTISFVTVSQNDGRVRLRWNMRWFNPAFYVRLSLDGGSQTVRFAIFVLGGPLANFLLAAVCLVLAAMINTVPPAYIAAEPVSGWRQIVLFFPGNPLAAWLNIVTILNVGVFLNVLFPAGQGKFRTDGGRLWDLFTRNRRSATQIET